MTNSTSATCKASIRPITFSPVWPHRRGSLIASLTAAGALSLLALPAFSQTAPDLGSADSYAVVSGTFTNTTAGSIVEGDVCFTTPPAVNPSITGAVQTPCPAQVGSDQNAARADLIGQACTPIGAAVALDTYSLPGGLPGVFPPGCYSTTGAMTITTGATVELTGYGVHIFRPGGSLDPAANSNVTTIEGACPDNVFWVPGGATTIAANTTFVGTVFRGVADGLSITFGDSASLVGRALAFGSTVTIDNNAISVPAACPEEPGTIIVEKRTNPSGSLQGFSFTGDASGAIAHGEQIVVRDLAPGNYSATETVPAGWELTDIVCNDGDSTGNIAAATANFVLAAGETVTCVFINAELAATDGTITIRKQANPADTGTSFDFSGDLGNFSLMHGELMVETLAPGIYSVSESVPPGWQLDSATCSDGSPVNAINLAARENVTCTFTNSRVLGSIVVEKRTNPSGSLQDFSFTGDASGAIAHGEQIVVRDLAPGNYSATETVPAGWELTDIVCNDGDSTGNIGAATANFVVAAGETVTCVFINAELAATDGTITIRKQASPADTGTSFDFSGDLGNFSLMHGGLFVETLSPGTYAVNEIVPEDWLLASANCSDGSPVNAIAVAARENVTCTFVNTLRTMPINVPIFTAGGIALLALLMMVVAVMFPRRFAVNRR